METDSSWLNDDKFVYIESLEKQLRVIPVVERCARGSYKKTRQQKSTKQHEIYKANTTVNKNKHTRKNINQTGA